MKGADTGATDTAATNAEAAEEAAETEEIDIIESMKGGQPTGAWAIR